MGKWYEYDIPASSNIFETINNLPVTIELESSLAGINQYTKGIPFDAAALTIAFSSIPTPTSTPAEIEAPIPSAPEFPAIMLLVLLITTTLTIAFYWKTTRTKS